MQDSNEKNRPSDNLIPFPYEEGGAENTVRLCLPSGSSGRTVNLSILMERIEYDDAVAVELLTLFLTETADIMNFLQIYNAQKESSDKLSREAHKLKGMCRDIGCENLAQLAAQLENIQQAKLLKEYPTLLEQVQNSYCELQTELVQIILELQYQTFEPKV